MYFFGDSHKMDGRVLCGCDRPLFFRFGKLKYLKSHVGLSRCNPDFANIYGIDNDRFRSRHKTQPIRSVSIR